MSVLHSRAEDHWQGGRHRIQPPPPWVALGPTQPLTDTWRVARVSHSQAGSAIIGSNWGEGLPAKSSQLWLLVGHTRGGFRILPTLSHLGPTPEPEGPCGPGVPELKAPQVTG